MQNRSSPQASPSTSRHPVRHVKIPGFVTSLEPDGRWSARLYVEGTEVEVDMRHDVYPLPEDCRHEGTYFFVHTTKRGRTYLYWPRAYWTHAQLSRIRKRARAEFEQLRWLID